MSDGFSQNKWQNWFYKPYPLPILRGYWKINVNITHKKSLTTSVWPNIYQILFSIARTFVSPIRMDLHRKKLFRFMTVSAKINFTYCYSIMYRQYCVEKFSYYTMFDTDYILRCIEKKHPRSLEEWKKNYKNLIVEWGWVFSTYLVVKKKKEKKWRIRPVVMS